MAKSHLDAHLPGGAGPEIDALMAGFGSPQQADDDPYAPVLIGQLKSVAKPFYDRLMVFSFDTRANLQARGLPSDWSHDYPWPPAPSAEGQPGYDSAIRATWAEGNFAPVLLGQLKLVFSFDLSVPAGQLPAWWVAYYLPGQPGVTPSGDADDDGLDNLTEYDYGTNPGEADSDGDGANDGAELAVGSLPSVEDSDSDGMWDGYEIDNGLSVLNDDTIFDKDGDGVPNLWEYIKETQAGNFNDVPPWDWIVDAANADLSPTDNIVGTIGEAINAVPADNGTPAQSYQTILVKNGTYPESLVIPADKRIALVAEKSASPVKVIGADKDDHVLEILGKSVVDGLWVTRPASVERNGTSTGFGVRSELASGESARVANTIVSGHRAAAAVVSYVEGVVHLDHVTIANNHADAIWSYAGGVAVTNSILWNPDANFGEILGSVSAFNNIVRGGVHGIDQDPLLRPNGTLSPGSSAINEAMGISPAGLDIHGEEPNGGERDIGADEWVDSDGDSLPDVWEWLNFTNLDTGAGDQSDDDTLNNLAEYIAGTNPLSGDTDSDGMRDDREVAYNLDPNSLDENRNQVSDGDEDFDGDGISNANELENGLDPSDGGETDPNQSPDADPDGDGETNVDEINGYHTDPLKPDCFIRMPEISGFPLTSHQVPLPVPWDFYSRTFPIAEYPDVQTEEETEEGTEASVFVRFNSGPFVVDDDFLINDQPVVSLNFGERGKICNVTEIWNTGSDKVAKGTSTFFGNAYLEDYRIVYLLPFEVMDINDHADTGDDLAVQAWDTTKPIADSNIAWIDAHTSDQNPAPRMPQLEFRMPGLPQGITIEAKLEVKYERGNGARHPSRTDKDGNTDTVKIPENGGFKTDIAGDTWQIWNEYPLQTEGFFGGDATLTYRLKSGTNEIFAPQTIKFRIGGQNPVPARARQYIESLTNAGPAGALWFAYAIAKSETKDRNNDGTRYNHFWQLSTAASDNYHATRQTHAGRPVWGNDGGTTPGGYGLFQVTGNADDATANIPRQQIWNWQENARAGLVILESKRAIADAWMIRQKNANNANGVALPNLTVRSVTFAEGTNRTMNNAVTMKAWNGASAAPAGFGDPDGAAPGFIIDPQSGGHFCYWKNFASGTNKWALSRYNNPLGEIEPFNYVNRVCQEVE